ncbi:MAG: SH3 domain-containing protein [Anaerolineae bacterium]|nr:SH3 domain-containing protein [Anaerolineae bacterium]
MKASALRWSLLLFSLLLATVLLAQEATPESTPAAESTAEATAAVEATAAPESTPEATPEADECPAIVAQALDRTRQDCTGVQDNEACYGNIFLNIVPQTGVNAADIQFGNPGDTVDIVKVRSLTLSPMDITRDVWGVALIQAQLKNDVPQGPPPAATAAATDDDVTQDVTFLLFGDTALQQDVPLLNATARATVNVRSTPETGSRLGSLAPGEAVILRGRLADNTWLLVTLADLSLAGWVAARFLEIEGDLATLDIVEPEQAQPQGPMQAFVFQSGVNDAPCDAAPNSGMLVQTPEGVASVTISIDEVTIQLNATAFIQAQPDGTMSVTALDGTARVEANGESRTIVAGTRVDVPLDENLQPADVPGEIQPLDPDQVNALPTSLLPNPVTVPAPLNVRPGVPLPGVWRFVWGVASLTCPTGDTITFDSTGILSELTAADDGSSLQWNASTYTQVSSGVYSSSRLDAAGNLYQETMNVNAPDSITGTASIDFAAVVCTLEVPFSLRLAVPGS